MSTQRRAPRHRSAGPARTLLACLGLAGVLVAAGCGQPRPAASATSSVPTSSVSAERSTGGSAPPSTAAPGSGAGGSTTGGSAPRAAGCPPGGGAMPAGAVSRPVVDVDGDGRPDTGWLRVAAGAVRLGVTTASGATFDTTVDLAGPAARQALIADVNGRGTDVAFVTDNRTVNLYRITGCRLVTVLNPQHQPYQFDRGFRGTGTGVGCVDATGDGVPDLVGLDVRLSATGAPTSVARTVITLDGTNAANGVTSVVPVTAPDQADLAQQVSCGQETMANSGLVAQ